MTELSRLMTLEKMKRISIAAGLLSFLIACLANAPNSRRHIGFYDLSVEVKSWLILVFAVFVPLAIITYFIIKKKTKMIILRDFRQNGTISITLRNHPLVKNYGANLQQKLDRLIEQRSSWKGDVASYLVIAGMLFMFGINNRDSQYYPLFLCLSALFFISAFYSRKISKFRSELSEEEKLILKAIVK